MGCNSSFLLLLLQVQSAFIVSVGQKCALLLLLFLFRCWCSRALSATQLGSHSVACASKHSSSRETDGQRTNALDSTRHASFSLPLLIFLLLLLVVVVVVPLLLIDESCDSPSTTIDAARALPLSNSPSLPPSSSSTHSSALPLLPLTHSLPLLAVVVVAIVHARFLSDSLSLARKLKRVSGLALGIDPAFLQPLSSSLPTFCSLTFSRR